MKASEKDKLLKQIFWDYNISVRDINNILNGREEKIGHIDQAYIFQRLLESYSWFVIIQILTPEEIKHLLSSRIIEKLRTPALKQKYEFVRKRLHEII